MPITDDDDAEEKAERLAQEKKDLDDVWKDLVTSVLSNTRLDPKDKGKKYEFFIKYEGEVSDKMITALQRSKYGQSFRQFMDLWKKDTRTGRDKPELYLIAEVFKGLSTTTQSLYREIVRQQKDKPAFSDLEILAKAEFLTTHFWSDANSQFDVHDVSTQLNEYLFQGVQWAFLEQTIFKMCLHRAVDEQRKKGKRLSETLTEKWFGNTSMFGAFVQMGLMFIGWSVPRLIGLGINIAIVVWALKHLSDSWAILAILALMYVALTFIGYIIHWGTREIRESLKMITKPSYPDWNEWKPYMPIDLWAMDKAVNSGYQRGHINLRLVRDQLIRLQTTNIDMPLQLVTFIDRAIAEGQHYW